MTEKKELKLIDFVSMFLRTFLIQSVWNFKSMVSIGFCFALVPVAKRVCETPEEYRNFYKRHLSFFNAHPYFASYAIGAIARLEADYAASDIKDSEQIEKFKNALIGPLGAMGDHYFWAIVRPASLLLGLAAVAVIPGLKWRLIFLGVLFMLYNIPHFYIRAIGLWRGYKEGFNVYRILKIKQFNTALRIYQMIGVLAVAVLFGYTLSLALMIDWKAVTVFLVSVFAALVLRLRNFNVYLPVSVSLLIALMLGWL